MRASEGLVTLEAVSRCRARVPVGLALTAAFASLAIAAFLVIGPGTARAGSAVQTPRAHTGSTSVGVGPATTTNPTTSTTTQPPTRLSSAQATKLFLANHKVAQWLKRYPPRPTTSASFSDGTWTIDVFYSPAGEIATGMVADASGVVSQAWTGPQVAWGMARGGNGFGGKTINSYPVWLAFCAVFLLGLVDWRRVLSLRTIDLLVLLSFSASLWFFNRGNIFAAMPLVYPGFVWLIARCLMIARSDRGRRTSVVWPTWLLVLATLCLVVVRIDINVNHSNVIDVGLSGVIGAQRIAHFRPVRQLPSRNGSAAVRSSRRVGGHQGPLSRRTGECEAADAPGGTYGPVAYEAYLPGYLMFGWSGLWDSLPAAHATTVLWDLIAIAGLWLLGLRFGGPRLGATLAFAWAAWPFTLYSASSNTNDLIEPALLVWGFYFATSPFKRGAFSALAAWTKFSALIVLPLWSGYPDARALRPRLRYIWGFVAATAVVFVILLFDPSPVHAVQLSTTTRSVTSSAARRRSRCGTGGSITPRACPTSAGFSGLSLRCSSVVRSRLAGGHGGARPCDSRPTRVRSSSGSRWC